MAKNRTASIVKIIIFILIVGGIFAYIFLNSRLFITGPQINVENPKNGALIEDNALIRIEGKALNIAYIWLNGRQIYTDEEGNFSESLLLQEGYNIIQITADDRFGRSKMEELGVVFKGSEMIDVWVEEIGEIGEPVTATTSLDII